jgi:hypothetical protein
MGNKREIRIYGMKRSGHHAIVFWVGNHIDGDAIYINDVYPPPIRRGLQPSVKPPALAGGS